MGGQKGGLFERLRLRIRHLLLGSCRLLLLLLGVGHPRVLELALLVLLEAVLVLRAVMLHLLILRLRIGDVRSC